MNAVVLEPAARALPRNSNRLDYLDATRAFALLLGVAFHASLSFTPYFMAWAVMDVSTSPLVAVFIQVSHSFRMELFFLLAGFFSWTTFHRAGAGTFLRSRAVRLGIPFVAGWFILRPLLVACWIAGFASMRGEYHVWPALRDGWKSLNTLPSGLFTGTHLWFLYYLALLTVLAVAARGLLAGPQRIAAALRRRADAFVNALAHGWWQMPVAVAGIAPLLWKMSHWGVDTPDQSLAPDYPVLALYGGFFALGWLLARQPELMAHFSRITPARLGLAVASVGVVVVLSAIERDASHPHFTAAHVGYVGGYAVMMWTLLWLTVGVFRRLCVRPIRAVRYLADSSYWMYLVHLPIVVALQIAVADLSVPWWGKFTFVTLATVGFALLTYDLFVRSTWIGAIINGRRKERVLWSNGVAASSASVAIGAA